MGEDAQKTGMLSREQLVHLFSRFSAVTCLPEAKKRIAAAVMDQQEAVAVTTAIQEEIFLEMGVGESLPEEMACEEAELEPDEFAKKMDAQNNLQSQQLEMLKYTPKFHTDDQSTILEKLHEQLENANFDNMASIMPVEQLQEVIRRKTTSPS